MPFHYNDNLAKADDMVVVEMTDAEISSAIGFPKEQPQIIQLHKQPSEKPGPGWVKTKKGTWKRKKK